ncbi:MAG: glutamine--fructose-6-phosphate transaminase (isomerizing) [Acutalibacteraceae bacterium]|nr:glutamine--fructose-6-phosphate transaminase (isomerizing) [Acutalibacteraceae bacterium]
MCGIVGYIGDDKATPILLDGLEKLEYRGYDSAGVAVYQNHSVEVVKSKGRLKNLCDILASDNHITGTLGIGHTRWATHGEPSDINSHPHCSEDGSFAVVHNGIIENYLYLRDYLMNKGKRFASETDTEVIAQLLEYYYNGNILDTIIKVLNKIEGAYALGIICKDDPDTLYAVRKDSPLIIGLGEGENFIASDIPAIIDKTRDIYRLNDNEIAVIKRDNITVYNEAKEIITKNKIHIDWDITAAEKEGYEHFMLKEIMEQPKAVHNTISPRLVNGKIVLDELKLTKEDLQKLKKIVIVACGSAYHVGVVAKYAIEKTVRIPVEIDIASEFRYRDPIIDENVLVLVISQSGETADTLAALREAKKLGARVLSIVNVVGSSIANESDDVLYTWAGPEISVATTKAYSTQLCVVYLLVLYMADLLGTISKQEYQNYVADLEALPSFIEKTISDTKQIQAVAAKYYQCENIFFIGRNIDYALSLEGSLKLKEISYIHSEAYAAGELKHGSISLIEDGTLVVSLATYEALFDKMMSNIKEVKARGATVLSVATEDKTMIESETDEVFYIPNINSMMAPSLAVLPLQLFAYYVADNRGCDIDKPRNLAKSVTVE